MSSPPGAGTTIRFNRKKYFPSEWNTGADRFCALFHKFGYIYKPLVEGSWLSAEEKWQLSDTEILKAIACAHRRFFLGTRSGKASRYAVLDVDSNSKYHCLEAIQRIQAVLAAAGINKIVPYQSSSSGGWHLYIFFDQAVSSLDLNKQLTLLMQLSDFEVRKGQLEIFPNPGESRSMGYGLRLPMQPGWGWLDLRTMELDFLREEITPLAALDLFLFDLDNESNPYHSFHQLKRYVEDMHIMRENSLNENASTAETEKIKRKNKTNVVSIRRTALLLSLPDETSATVARVFGNLPPGILPDVWLRGKAYFDYGLSGPSQRADAIFSIGHYLFYGDPEVGMPARGYGYEQTRQSILEEVLSNKHNGKSADLNSGRSDAFAQIHRATHWRPESQESANHTKYVTEPPISWVLENAKRKRNARSRIQQAVQELKAEGQKRCPTTIQAKAKCSWQTLYKHSDLWKEAIAQDESATDILAYEQISKDIFSISTHEYNAVLESSSENSDSIGLAFDSSSELFECSTDVTAEFESEFLIDRSKRSRITGFQDPDVWKLSILANISFDYRILAGFELERLLTFLLWRRESAPDYESEIWIARFISKLRALLARQRADHCLWRSPLTG